MPGAAQLSSWTNWIPSTLLFLHATKFLQERPRQWLEMACSYHKGNSSSLHLIPCLDLKSGWERGQLGAGWTLPWNAMAGCFETTALPCGEQAAGRKRAHVLYRALIARQCAPTKHWSYHKLLHAYDQETPSSRKCLSSSSLCCVTPWVSSFLGLRDPEQSWDNLTVSPENIRLQVYLGTGPHSPSTIKRQHRAQSAEAGHQCPFVCAMLSSNKRHASNPLSFRLHLNVWFPGWNSCPSIDSSWRNEVEIYHVAILSSFPTAFQVSPGISFPREKKRAEAELEEFLIPSCFPDLVKATEGPQSPYAPMAHAQKQLQTCMQQALHFQEESQSLPLCRAHSHAVKNIWAAHI